MNKKLNKPLIEDIFYHFLFSHTMHLYQCFATQMALLGLFIEISFQNNKSISMAFQWFLSFYLPVRSIHAGAHVYRHCKIEFTLLGTWEDVSIFFIFEFFWNRKVLGLVLGSNPGHLRGRRVLYPLRYAPRATINYTSILPKIWPAEVFNLWIFLSFSIYKENKCAGL